MSQSPRYRLVNVKDQQILRLKLDSGLHMVENFLIKVSRVNCFPQPELKDALDYRCVNLNNCTFISEVVLVLLFYKVWVMRKEDF